MKIMNLFLFLLMPLYCLGEPNKPARDYTMINLQDGLTCTLLDVGTTSFTFSVEWSLETEAPNRWLFLMGKLDLEPEVWSGLITLEINPDQGNATFEIRYDALPWYYFDFERPLFEQKAFFSVIESDPNTPGGDGIWSDDEESEETKGEIAVKEDGAQKVLSFNHAYLGLCAGIAFALCAVFYFVRKKFSKDES